jgi:hypothetical protein
MAFKTEYTNKKTIKKAGLSIIGSKVVCTLAHPPACPPRLIDLRARPTRKYMSIFEHIRDIFKEFLENMSSIPGSRLA